MQKNSHLFTLLLPTTKWIYKQSQLVWWTLTLGMLAVKKLLRKRHRDRQFLAWCSLVWWQEILLQVFHSTFWAFLCISKAPFGRSLWSGHHWKDILLLQKLRIDRCQFWSKVMTSEKEERPRFITGGTDVNGLSLPSVLHKLDETSNPWELNYRLNLNGFWKEWKWALLKS